MAIPSVSAESLGVEHEELARSDQGDDLEAEDAGIADESQAMNQDDDAFEQRDWTTEESEECDPESNPYDDAAAENVEITEGGWICRVERFEKHVDSRGHTTYCRPPKESSPPLVNQDLKDARNAETLETDESENDVPQAIIIYIHHVAKSKSGDLIEPEIYIEVKSPLILEVLRQSKSYMV